MGVVGALLAAGTTYLLVRTSDDDRRGGDGGTAEDGGQCSGDYCVGGYPYVNACGVFDPTAVATRLGAIGNGRLSVQETYADPLPRVADPARAAWTYGLTSSCHIAPEDPDGAVFYSVDVQLKQTANEAPEPAQEGRPLEGTDGAVVEDIEGGARVHWRHRNVSAVLEVVWGNRKAPISDATIVALVETIAAGLANPPSEPTELGDLSEGDEQIVVDACEVFTGADFQSATKYVVAPTNVSRNYNTPISPPLTSTCRRFTATPNAGFPEQEGTTFLDGSMAPKVTVSTLQDPAAAAAELGENRALIAEAVDIPGLGDAAVFGIGSGSHFTLQFTSGFHLVTIDCGLSNGNADWTPEDMRSRLEPLAQAIAGRMG